MKITRIENVLDGTGVETEKAAIVCNGCGCLSSMLAAVPTVNPIGGQATAHLCPRCSVREDVATGT